MWSTAASTGEEPYSIAITLGDALGERAGSCQVWASDIDTQVLEKAEAGIYRHEDLRTLTPIQMQRYFLRGTGPHQGLVRVRQELAVHLPAAESAGGGVGAAGAVRRDFLPQRDDLFR